MKIGLFGTGAYGLALSDVLVKNGCDITMWTKIEEEKNELESVGKIEKYHNIYIVYTKEAQTADMFIERTTHQMSNEYQISVVTSDALEQIIVMAKGARRISSREFVKEVEYLTSHKMKEYIRNKDVMHDFPLEQLKYEHYKEENDE